MSRDSRGSQEARFWIATGSRFSFLNSVTIRRSEVVAQECPKQIQKHRDKRKETYMSDKKTKVAQKRDRAAGVVSVAGPGRVQRARKAGFHGKQTDAEGKNNAEPKKHPPTDGGKSGLGGKQ